MAKIFTYRSLPVTFLRTCEYEFQNFDIEGYIVIRDDGTPIDRFEVFTNQIDRNWIAWTGDTVNIEIKNCAIYGQKI